MSGKLNEGQQRAADGFFKFLFEDTPELVISGPGGVGKTYLMGYLIDEIMPRYHQACKMVGIDPKYHSVAMTATTNKAAEVLGVATQRPTETIHKFLNLRVFENFTDGTTKLKKTHNWQVYQNMIIFIDEASMIDHNLLQMIREGTHQCKVVYVGDHCQLAPIKEPLSPVYRQDLPFFELTEPMRNSGQPALLELCRQLRYTVENKEFMPIKTVPGVVDHLTPEQMETELEQAFKKPTADRRILAYTNRRVNDYNNYVRSLREYEGTYMKGEILVNNSSFSVGRRTLSVEDEVEILSLGSPKTIDFDGVELDVVYADIQSPLFHFPQIPLPLDKEHFNKLVKFYQKEKDWKRYFALKNTFPDLRPRDACTVHKSQGSTYDTVYVDLSDLSSCRNPDQAARLLYVAFTRAKERVVLYGDLAKKFGGLEK